MSNEQAQSLLERMDTLKEAKLWVRQKQVPGEFNLPPLLEARRLEHGIPAGAFAYQAVYNRILVWQLPADEAETYVSGGRIVKTGRTKQYERDTAARGIIVSAGLSSLDYLRSNGMDLGHKISFVRLSPMRDICDTVGRGIEQEVLILQAGDIVASFDLAANLKSGHTQTICWLGVHKHVVDGVEHTPQDPRLSNDY